MTTDGLNALDLRYNYLNLTSEISGVYYSWLADGTKAGATTADGTFGLEYIGSLIYRRNGNSLELESTSFGGGRIDKTNTGYEASYFVTDHLSSTRVTFNQNKVVTSRNNYMPFGTEWYAPMFPTSDNRWRYNGKELQVISDDIPYMVDYGARMRDPRLVIWNGPDPLAWMFTGESPYNFTFSNPITLVDRFGLAPMSSNSIQIPEVTVTAPPVGGGLDFFGRTIFQNMAGSGVPLRTEAPLPLGENMNPVPIQTVTVTAKAPKITGTWQYGIPVWGSARMASDAFEAGQLFNGVGWFMVALAEAASFGLLSYETQPLKVAALNSARGTAVVGVSAGAKGVQSFAALKRVLGPAGKGMAWHHIVEQTPGNIAKFGSQAIHNTANVVRLSHGAGSMHAQISAYYSSIRPTVTSSTTMTVRQWLSTQSYQAQYDFGVKTLRSFGYTF